jgi:hypothetical protein
MALGLSSPLPRPPTARRSRCKGARNAREPATHPCGANGASGSHSPLLRFSREGSAATARTRNWAHVEGLDAKRPPTDQRI